MEKERRCAECGKQISGRSDRIFCGDACRVSHNNRKYCAERKGIKEINRILIKNHAILRNQLQSGGRCCHFSQLSRKGFNFTYITSLISNPEKRRSYLRGCYELYYSIDQRGDVTIVPFLQED